MSVRSRSYWILYGHQRTCNLLKDNEVAFMFNFMDLTASAAFSSEQREWYLDDDFSFHLKQPWDRVTRKSIISPIKNRYLLRFEENAFKYLRGRLMKCALEFGNFMTTTRNWRGGYEDIVATCIAVAEITQEIGFLIFTENKTASEIFHSLVTFSYRDGGILHRLSTEI